MKKFLLSLIALLGFSAYALGAGQVTVADAEILQGGKGIARVSISFPEGEFYRDFSFDIELPDGITYVNSTMGDACTSYHSMTPGERTECHGSGASDTKLLCLSNGVIANVEVQADADLAVGTELTGYLKTVEISDDNGNAAIRIESIPFTIRIVNSLVLDENDELLPSAFAVGSKGNVTVKRTIKPNTWNTIVLPFVVKKNVAAEIFGADAEYATFDGWTVEVEENEDGDPVPAKIKLQFKSRTVSAAAGNLLLAGTPYLIKTSQEVTEIPMNDVTLAANKNVDKQFIEEDYSGAEFTGSFISTFTKTTIPEKGLFIRDGKFYYSKGQTVIKGFRGYFDLGLALDEVVPMEVKFEVFVDGEATPVEGVNLMMGNGAVYTIDGKFIGRDVDLKKLQKGIYVVNGKKIAIK